VRCIQVKGRTHHPLPPLQGVQRARLHLPPPITPPYHPCKEYNVRGASGYAPTTPLGSTACRPLSPSTTLCCAVVLCCGSQVLEGPRAPGGPATLHHPVCVPLCCGFSLQASEPPSRLVLCCAVLCNGSQVLQGPRASGGPAGLRLLPGHVEPGLHVRRDGKSRTQYRAQALQRSAQRLSDTVHSRGVPLLGAVDSGLHDCWGGESRTQGSVHCRPSTVHSREYKCWAIRSGLHVRWDGESRTQSSMQTLCTLGECQCWRLQILGCTMHSWYTAEWYEL